MGNTGTVTIPQITQGGSGDNSGVTPITGSPKKTRAVTLSLAVGMTADLDSDQISVGLTGQLVAVQISGTQPYTATQHEVTNGVATLPVNDYSSWDGHTLYIQFPDPRYFTVAHDAGAGFDGFRITVLNCGTGTATGDYYVTFFYEEV